MESMIATENAAKVYGRVKAVDGVTLRVGKGEIYGFLGLNGAGKTTTSSAPCELHHSGMHRCGGIRGNSILLELRRPVLR